MAFDGTLKFDTTIDQTGFQLGLDGLGSIAKKGMSVATKAVTAATGAVAALGAKAVDVGKGFESSMAQVIATMGITKETIQDGVNSYALLKEAAADAGESTTFSASQAADALNYLALAGYSAAQASEALPAVLNLAAAGGLELAYASDLATDAMAALGIAATKENLTAFGDQMAKTASKANTSVAQLGEAILTVGGTAKSLAGGTTELNAALGVLANRGIKGSEGGTALRNMILALSAPTDKAAAQMNALGLEVLDAAGKMRPLNEIFQDLDQSLSTMTEGEQTQVLNSIFNKVDLKSAQAMLAGCGGEFDALTDALSHCDGAMAQMAVTMNDTLEGDMKSLGSKAEALGIAVYDSLNEPLRELAQLGGAYISQLTAAFQEGGFEGLAASLGDVLGQAVTKLASYAPKLVQLGISVVSSLTKGLAQNAPTIANAALSVGMLLLEGIFSISADLLELGASLLVSLAAGITEHLPEIVETAQSIITQLTQSIITNLPLLITAGIDILTALLDAISENIDLIISSALTVIQTLCESLLNGENLQKLLDAGLKLLMSLTQAIVDNLPLLIDIAIQILTFLCTELLNAENITKLADAALQILTAVADALVDNLDTLLLAVEEIIQTLCDDLLNTDNLDELWETGGELLGNIVRGLMEIGGKLLGFAANVLDAIWESVRDTDWAEVGIAMVDGILQGMFGVDLVGLLSDFGDNWMTGIKGIFGIHSPSKLMEDEVGKYLALGIGNGFADRAAGIGQTVTDAVSGWADSLHSLTNSAAAHTVAGIGEALGKLPSTLAKPLTEAAARVTEWGASLVQRGRDAAQSLAAAIPDALRTLPETMCVFGKHLVEGLWNGIAGMAGSLRSKIADFGSSVLQGFKETFGIHSPSTVMRDLVGKNLAAGIGIGFTAEIPDIGKDALAAFSDIELPKLDDLTMTVEMPDIPSLQLDPPDAFPQVDRDAVRGFRAISAEHLAVSGIQPSATSTVVHNSYTYNSNSNPQSSAPAPAPIHLHAQFAIDGEVVASAMVERVDQRQGETIILKERGTVA